MTKLQADFIIFFFSSSKNDFPDLVVFFITIITTMNTIQLFTITVIISRNWFVTPSGYRLVVLSFVLLAFLLFIILWLTTVV